MKPHERLDVWTKSIEFVVAVYKATEPFPKDERFGLTSQLRRAAVSIPQTLRNVRVASPPRNLRTSYQTLKAPQARSILNY